MALDGASKPTFLLLNARIAGVEAVKLLGRFVTHPDRPLDNSKPSDPTKIIQSEPVLISEHSTSYVISNVTHKDARIALEKLLGLSAEGDHKTKTNIKAESIKTYRLQNHYDAFDKLEANDEIKAALNGSKGLFTRCKGKLYMIIGVKVCAAKTTFKTVLNSKTGLQGHATLPISFIADPSTAGATMLAKIDPKVAGGNQSTAEMIQAFTTADEEVFAMEYKVVKQKDLFGFHDPKKEAVLAHNPLTFRWKNAVYDAKASDGRLEGKFDDDDEDDLQEPEERVKMATNERERFMDICNDALDASDGAGEASMFVEA